MTTSNAKRTPEPLALSGFGLWSECPEDVPVAWGARAIADNGCGFSIVHDRQTFTGPPELRKAFSKVLNQGPLKRAIEESKRLRDGWTPYKDLGRKAFEEYWKKRMKEEPELFESFLRSSNRNWSGLDEGPEYPHYDAPKDAEPSTIYGECQDEHEEVEEYNKRYEELEAQGEGIPLPDPPSMCEGEEEDGEGEDCGQRFRKIRGEWDGCNWEGDAWVCENCGHWNYVEEDEDDEWAEPKTPFIDAYGKIVGGQSARMRNDKSELFTLYDDDFIIVKGNTNASFGYVYLIAYPKHDVVDIEKVKRGGPPFDEKLRPMAAPEDVYWSGPFPIPMPGDTVNITRPPEIGTSVVIAHRVEHNILLLITAPEGSLPDWRDKDRLFPTSDTWNVTGNEISEEVKRAET